MRFIGNKEYIVDKIFGILSSHGVSGESFFDFFSGATSVAKFFKRKDYRIYTSDLLYFSYCMQKAYIENNENPRFEKLLPIVGISTGKFFAEPMDSVIEYLNRLAPKEGFIYANYTPGGTKYSEYPRLYFSDENGKKIDAIRTQIEAWHHAGLLAENEYFILIATLIESVSFYANVAGVYAAFSKKWDPRAVKPLQLRKIEIIESKQKNEVYHTDSLSLLGKIESDILYIDPPYNSRQYAPNYHLLETIARYDNPLIYGVSGMRDYSFQKSSFCNKSTALKDLDRIAREAHYKYLVLSYNTEGIMPQSEIVSILGKYGNVVLEQFEYLRFKSNTNGLSRERKYVYEQVYILTKS